MAIYPTVTIEKLPRLADFAKWGYAIAEALGKSGEQFLEDFTRNVKNQNESVAEKNVLCQAVIGLMDGKPTYLNTVEVVLKELKALVGEDAKDETFPKLPHHLRGRLDVLRSTLVEHGITYQFFARQKDGVKILFTKSVTTAPEEEPSEAKTPAATSATPTKIVTLVASDAEKTGLDDEAGEPVVPGEAGEAKKQDDVLDTFDFGEFDNV